MVTGNRFYRIIDFIRDRHYWLLVSQRIKFKLCALVYCSLYGFASCYIYALVHHSTPVERRPSLRSGSCPHLAFPRYRKKFTERAFAVAGPLSFNLDCLKILGHLRRFPSFERDAMNIC